MGGIGSGAKRSVLVGTVEDSIAIDIRRLKRQGAIRPGCCVVDSVTWGERAPRAFQGRLRADLSGPEPHWHLSLDLSTPDGPVRQQIGIVTVPSSLGGRRCYFLCPETGQRCEVLYYAGGRFASRVAQKLSYAAQGMTDLSRARRKVAKLRSRLSGDGPLPRPRGNNRIAIAERLEQATFEAKALYHDRLAAYAERSGTPRVPSARR